MKNRIRTRISSARRISGIVVALALMSALLEIALGNVRAFQVISRSMEPTLQVGDCVLSVRELATGNLRGKVVAFEPEEPGDALVKRVIATGGQTVTTRKGALFVEGLRDSYSEEPIHRTNDFEFRIPGDRLFVVGDNRNNSYDSIDHGPINRYQVLGVVAFRYWPLDRIGTIR